MEETNKTIEQEVADTILQREETIQVGKHKYTIAPPSVATLVLASEIISRMPHLKMDETKVIEDSLAIAKDCKELGILAATLVLGAKHVNDIVCKFEIQLKFYLFGLFHTKRRRTIERKHIEVLAEELMEDLTPRELQSLVAQILQRMQVGDFFALTTFLTEISLTRPTKVGTKATASGL